MLKWEARLDSIRDRRKRPQILTRQIVRGAVVMFLCRLGSLNALAQMKGSRFWSSWVGAGLPSADTVGRVASLIDPSGLRALQRGVYTELKRGKALSPPWHGLMAATLDGHESHATFRRCCEGCLRRTVHTAKGDRLQYYHRYVALGLIGKDMHMMRDAEEQRPGEDEVGAALRLLERVLEHYPRAFQLVVADGAYADPRVFNLLIEHGKDALATLKENHPALIADAVALMEGMAPERRERGGRVSLWWDIEGFTSWTTVKGPVRIMRSLETAAVRRQIGAERQEQQCDWLWVTTLKRKRARTAAAVEVGHGRWQIENQGFNELVNRWHADHVYRHEPGAMLVFLLLAMACMNLFAAFYRRNLKPAVRLAVSTVHVARQMAAELYAGLPGGGWTGTARAPT